MSAGGYVGPIGPGASLGLGGLGQAAGGFGQMLGDAAKSVFSNEQVAQGVRNVVGAIKGGTPVQEFNPGFLANPAQGPTYGSMPGDWDANAWRPNGMRPGANLPPGNDGLMFDGPEGGNSLLKQGLGEIGSGMLNAARNSAIFSGIISLAINGYKVVRGHERVSDAAGSVVADTAGGAVSGAMGALASGVALAAAGAAGLTVGLPLTLLGVAAGLGGALLSNWAFKRTGLYDGIRNGVARLFGAGAIGNSVGREMPLPPWGQQTPGYGSIGGMVPVNPNLGRPIPMH